LNGTPGIITEMDVQVAKALGTTPGIWYAMQGRYDMWQAQKNFRGRVRRIHAAA
jgi:plasmid maintenance system antidote protein VapI